VIQISAGTRHTCALKNDYTIVCWGLNSSSQTIVPAEFAPSGIIAQSITFTSTPPNPAFVGASSALSATGGASGNPVTFRTLTVGACQVTGNTVSFIDVGTCTVAGAQAASPGYDAAPQQTQSFEIVSRVQLITFISNAPNPGVVDSTYAPQATGGASGNPVTFTSNTSTRCTVNTAGIVTFIRIGTCTIAANQSAGGGYTAASTVMQDITVMARQTIVFSLTPTSPALADTTYTIAATGGRSVNPVVFSSTTPAVCTVNKTTVTLRTFGTCTIAANQAGSATYLAAPTVLYGFTVFLRQVITFTSKIPTTPVVGGTYAVSATGGASGRRVVFSVDPATVCSIKSGIVKFGARGTCTITATQAGNATYAPANPATQLVKIR